MKQEQKEINVLLNQGFRYEIKYKETTPPRGPFGLFGKTKTEIKTETFHFQEPTLAVLDLVTEIYLKMNITEADRNAATAEAIQCANRTVHANTELMAEAVAIFALGENAFTKTARGYERNALEIERVKELFIHTTTPTQLERLVSVCTALGNLPGFLNSIRLTGASRTTRPADLVE